jgi:hypothetical protein
LKKTAFSITINHKIGRIAWNLHRKEAKLLIIIKKSNLQSVRVRIRRSNKGGECDQRLLYAFMENHNETSHIAQLMCANRNVENREVKDI